MNETNEVTKLVFYRAEHRANGELISLYSASCQQKDRYDACHHVSEDNVEEAYETLIAKVLRHLPLRHLTKDRKVVLIDSPPEHLMLNAVSPERISVGLLFRVKDLLQRVRDLEYLQRVCTYNRVLKLDTKF